MAPTQGLIPIPTDKPDGIEIPTDSSSAYGEYESDPDNDGGVRLKEQTGTGRRQASPKRKSEDGSGDSADNSPSAKRQRLPMRVKDTGPIAGRRKIDVEIPPPARLAAGGGEILSPVRVSGTVRKDGQSDDDEQRDVFVTPNAPASKKIVFDDDEHEEFVTPLEAPAVNPLDQVIAARSNQGAASDEDDDAPPDAVSTQQAASQSIRSAKAAIKAAQEHDAALKRRRKERDVLLKTQAETRKRTKAAAAVAAAVDPASSDASAGEVEHAPPARRKRKLDIPAVLPAELLESDSEDEDPGSISESAAARRPKKTKLNTAEKRMVRESRPPRDERVGPTVYRVAAGKRDVRLAPKLSKYTRNAKQQLLVRNRFAQKGGGFFS